MLITLKEAAQWAEENLNIEVTPATLRSACVDRRLKAKHERCANARRGQPREWKVGRVDLIDFLTGKYRPRKNRSPRQPKVPVQLVQTSLPALPPPVKNKLAPPVIVQPEQGPKPRYKVLELVLQPTLVDFDRHEVYDMRVIKKNIPKHATAEKLATELAARAIQARLSHQLRYVVEEYLSQPRRK
ncbi:MAG: hypothetical protein JWP00_3018 [Chloroflexi bacterium]|jgi:hypothetical protein|nr:hypothetical protein [Chloroflexota bacterium]